MPITEHMTRAFRRIYVLSAAYVSVQLAGVAALYLYIS